MIDGVEEQQVADPKECLVKAAQALKAAGRIDLAKNVLQIIHLLDTPDSEQIAVPNLHI